MRSRLKHTVSLAMRALVIAGMALLTAPRIPAQDPAAPAEAPAPPEPVAPAAPVVPPAPVAPVVPPTPTTPRRRPPALPGVVRPAAAPGVVRPSPALTGSVDTNATPASTNAALSRGRFQPPELSADVAGDAEAKAPELKFENSPSDIVLQTYARETGRTLLLAPDVPKANISLRSQTALNRREYLQAIQTVLRMNNIALLPLGDKFLKVVNASTVIANAIETEFEEPESGQHEDRGDIVSQMIQLRYITIDEASKAISPFKRGEGQIQVFERTNSILLTDRAENVNRMMEIIRFIDQPRAVREVVNVRPIKYAKAANIKQRLEEIVAESQKTQQAGKATPQANPFGAPGIHSVAAPLPLPSPVPGVVRAPLAASLAPTPANNAIVEALMDEAERGVVRGKVQILADDRTNLLIIITQPENMTFFDRIINVLDVETTPDVGVEVFRLEYADAEEVAKMLNDLIGNAKADQPKGATTGAAAAGTGEAKPGEAPAANRSATLADFAERLRAPAAASAAASATAEPGKSKVGELSKDNIKILANKRTNALIIMASKSDTATIREIVRDMDIMLSQVLIETVVLDVTLTSGIDTGINWFQRTMKTQGLGGNLNPLYYSGAGGAGNATPVNLLSTALTNLSYAGAQYFFTLPNLNVDAVIQASSSDGRAKILTSPVLLTQDNKEATIEATQLRYLFKGYTTSGYNANGTPVTQANVDQANVGLTVKVTPRINVKGMVSLKVDETYEDVGPDQTIDGQAWPTTQTRKLSADIAVKSGETVILGGLVRNEKQDSTSKVPILGDIPFIGAYLFGSTSTSDSRSELLIFLTPYVLDTSEAMAAEARRRKNYLDVKGMWTKGWSDSKLADESITQKMRREKDEHAAVRALEHDEVEEARQSKTPVSHGAGVMSVTVATNVFVSATNALPTAPEQEAVHR